VAGITDMSDLFYGAWNADPVLSSWNTANTLNMGGLFRDMGTAITPRKLQQGIQNWNTGKVTSMSGMFRSANFTSIATASWDVSKVTDFSYMFYEAEIASAGTSNWNTAALVNTSNPKLIMKEKSLNYI
jgi:hypothetical protein